MEYYSTKKERNKIISKETVISVEVFERKEVAFVKGNVCKSYLENICVIMN